MCHPGQEPFKAKTISAMFTAPILPLIREPVVWVFIKTVVLERLDQSIMIRDTAMSAFFEQQEYMYRIDPPTISPTPGMRTSADSVTRGS